MGAIVLNRGIKPDEPVLEAGLAAPEWNFFWDGSVDYLWLYWGGEARELIHNILPNAGAGNISRTDTELGRGIAHTAKVDFIATEIGPLFAPGTGGFTIISFANPPDTNRETMISRRAGFENLQIEFRANSNRTGGDSLGSMGFIVNDNANGGSQGGCTTPTTINDGNFHVYIGRRADDGTCSLWVDGIDRTTDPVSETADFDGEVDLALGGLPIGDALEYLHGKLLDIWVSRAWSDAEIRQYSLDPFGPIIMVDEEVFFVPAAAAAADEDAGLFIAGQQQPVIEPINIVPY